MADNLLQRARDGRSSAATLKYELSTIVSRSSEKLVFIFEGVDDVGAYEAWFNRVIDKPDFSILPGKGKGQLLALRSMLQRDATGLNGRFRFFVDKDFDDVRGQELGSDIHLTCRYSIENYFVEERVLESILIDEFRLSCEQDKVAEILSLYRDQCNNFSNAIEEINWRWFLRAKFNVLGGPVEKNLNKYISFDLNSVHLNVDGQFLVDSIPFDKVVSDAELKELETEFKLLSPLKDYRGKFWLAFFLGWLEMLADERKKGSGPFDRPQNIRFSRADFSPRNLASRSNIPSEIEVFLGGCCA